MILFDYLFSYRLHWQNPAYSKSTWVTTLPLSYCGFVNLDLFVFRLGGTNRQRTRMALRLSREDVRGFKFLLALALMYGLMAMLAYSVLHMKFVKPLGNDAPLDRFSEARAVEHVRVLSKEIDGRQVRRILWLLRFWFWNEIVFFLDSQTLSYSCLLRMVNGKGRELKQLMLWLFNLSQSSVLRLRISFSQSSWFF